MGAGLGLDVPPLRRTDSATIRRERIDAQSHQMTAELLQRGYVKMILNYEGNFDKLLTDFMERLRKSARVQYHSHLANLVTRLDYNGFFSSVSVGAS